MSGPVDFVFLEAFVGDDLSIADEVLELFRQQADVWTPMLAADQAGWRDAAHALKGAAGGIGARGLQAACADAEASDSALVGAALARVRDELDQALLAIAGWKRRNAPALLKA